MMSVEFLQILVMSRWEKKSKQNKCCVRGCSELHFVSSKVTDPEKLNEILAEYPKGTFQFQPLYVSNITTQYITWFSHSKLTALHVVYP